MGYQQSRCFFELPEESKMRTSTNVDSRKGGYTAFGSETLDPKTQTSGDTKEGYYYYLQSQNSKSKEDAQGDSSVDLRWIPADLTKPSDFVDALTTYYGAMD